MSWIITGAEKVPPTTWDPNFLNVSLLLHGNGANGSTSIIDSSPTPKTVTAVGNAQISTAQSKFGGASIAFDGTEDYLTVPSTGSPGDLGAGNFTVEFWHFLVSGLNSFPCLISNYSSFAAGSFSLFAGHVSSVALGFPNGLNQYQLALNGSGFPSINSTATIIYGAWVHVAVVRSGSTITLYVNGTASGTVTSTATLAGTNGSLWVGTAGDALATGAINGYIDDLRITKGVARYTGNFTPPTAPFPDI
jgi:hypothetical protein